MKQMITRLDDDLHARLKARAATEGRSVNELVIQALVRVLDEAAGRQAVRERARATGRLVVPQPPEHASAGPDTFGGDVGAGFGTAVCAALEAQRAAR